MTYDSKSVVFLLGELGYLTKHFCVSVSSVIKTDMSIDLFSGK